MRISDVVRSLEERRTALEKSVFKTDKFDEVDFAKAKGRWLCLGEIIGIIHEGIKNDEDQS